jgi:hypothetical protein
MLDDTTTVLTARPDAVPAFRDLAQLEFQASLQLLNERAFSVAGANAAAIALAEDGIVTYSTVAGASEREPGASVPVDAEPYRQCLAGRQPVRAASADYCCLVVPVLRDGKAVGLLELMSSNELADEVTESVVRLADLVCVAMEHRDAAQRADEVAFESSGLNPPAPTRWHAPQTPAEVAKPQPATGPLQPSRRIDGEAQPSARVSVAAVRNCSMCGFPVSTGRALCVECERKPHATCPAVLSAPREEESWISAHGYTIASLVVTALTAAIIVWLRR